MTKTDANPNFDRDLLFLLHDVARMQRTRFDRWARTYGLTRAQGVILFRLSCQPCLSQAEMAAILEVEPITVGRLVDRLEARGLIERRADPADRRIKRLHLLPAAAEIVAKIEAYRSEISDYLLDGISGAARETAVQVLLQMKNKLALESSGQDLAVGGE
ncbi:MAG TPA: MarR family transcriptional regulator [Rhizomicrobium sp.]|nr:MarR family transcriptional regulator [Rhizomicrobium sp.]